jgi:hypothetical protein
MPTIVRWRVPANDPILQNPPITPADRVNFQQQIQMSVNTLRQQNWDTARILTVKTYNVGAGNHHFTLKVNPSRLPNNDILIEVLSSEST